MAGQRQWGAYLAECFWSGVSQTDLDDLDLRVRRVAATTHGTVDEVRYRGSMLVPDDEVVLCFFDGPSRDVVASVAQRADIPFDRIVASIPFGTFARPPLALDEPVPVVDEAHPFHKENHQS